MFKCSLPIFLVILLSGCISSNEMSFTAVAVNELNEKFEVIQEDVSGESCENQSGSYGSYQEATDKAINSVPGANALINARFSKVEKLLSRICVKVTGDAIAI